MYEEEYFVEIPKIHVKLPNITIMCLNPKFRLRTQMMLSFGMTAVVALGSFILIGLYTASNSGKSVQNQARGVVTQLVKHSLSSTAQYVSETMTKKFNNIGGAGSLIAEATRDRFVGYPRWPDWEEDVYVPFWDVENQRNMYPINASDMPLDWELVGNVDESNYAEHILDRPPGWYDGQNVDTTHAAFFFQGACDPNATNATDPKYLIGCTDKNNDIENGGFHGTPTLKAIYKKAKDLTWILKPLYESHVDVKTVGVFFGNFGAGATIQYPATMVTGTDTFTSIGCQWMYTTHPRTGKLIASTAETNNCHKYGDVAPMREYNPVERGWCRDQVERDMDLARGTLSPKLINVMATGPYLDALSAERLWVLTFGQAVFDRVTDEFIACTLIDVSVEELYKILKGSSKVGETSESALARWDDFGTIVVATQWNPEVEEAEARLTDERMGLGVTHEVYQDMRNLVDFSQEWDPVEVKAIYKSEYFVSKEQLIMMAPVPAIPAVYDPLYTPQYLIVISISSDEAYGLLDEMEQLIYDDVTSTWEEIGLIGGIGFFVVVLTVAYISSTLTKPLRWMQKVSGMIIDNAGGADLKKGLAGIMDSRDAHPYCSPRTEVTKLLREFEQMINEFSTEGAAEVAGMKLSEVKNTFEWRRLYEDIYPWENEHHIDSIEKVPGTSIPRQLSITNTKMEIFEDELTTDSTNTDRSILSAIGAAVSASLVQASYSPKVQSVLNKAMPLVHSVSQKIEDAGIKAGLIKPPEPERVQGPPFINKGENLAGSADDEEDFFEGVASGDNSFLFWWTTLLVGTPILVTAILISVSVASSTTSLIPEWLKEVSKRSFEIEQNSIITANQARTYFGEEVLARFVRDLHIYSRLAGWLLFNGIMRADSFTEVATGANMCKEWVKNGFPQCPFLEVPENCPCDCEWDDPVAKVPAPWNESAGMDPQTCQAYPRNASTIETYNATDPRYLQRRYFESQADDVDEYGTRWRSSYPLVGNTTDNTTWWDNITAMPGAYKRENASGYNTTYDRVRVTSAMSVADISLYNYNPGIDEQKNLGTFLAFEYDGMMTGYTGCAPTHVFYPHWRSTKGNGGARARGDACPVGKYGYDARCRGWYATGKEKRGVYVTPPYEFASSNTFAGSATFSLEDPATGEFVGQALMDFLPDAFMQALHKDNTAIGHGTTGFPVVITPEADSSGNEVLVGPRYSIGQTAKIEDVVLPYDAPGSKERVFFEEEVASKMRNGEEGQRRFQRKTKEGLYQTVFMSYAPLYQRTLTPVDASDFGRGCTSKQTLIYSLGFGITTEDLVLPFTVVENEVTADVRRVQYISLALIVCAVLSVLYMTYTMCLYLSQPIMVLIAIVKSIRTKNLGDELPALDGGSCEIYDVYESLEQLCKIVRFSNTAVLKGDRNKSYRIMEDALDLFVRMGNQKALGVANNNLGTMVLQEQMERSSVTNKSDEVFFNGMKYFEEAIRIGTFEYQNAEFDDERGNFVKQLANRYFNRGMFLIVNRLHPMASPDLEATGVNDLVRAKQLDQEAYLLWRERGQLVDMACNEFGSYLRRGRGIVTLMHQDKDFQDVWGMEGLIEKADDMIHNPAFEDSNLFAGVNLVARKQQVNDMRIQFAMAKGETFEAAQIAIRLLVENEYIIDTVIMNCVTTLNTHYNLHGDPMQVPNLAKQFQRDTRRGAVDTLREAKNVIFCLDYSGSMNGERMQRANQNLRWVYEDHCLDKDFVGFVRFNHAVDSKLYFDLGRKSDNQEHQEDILFQATDAEGGTRLYAALNKCVSMAIASPNSFDTWIIALTDGESAWDFPAKSVIARVAKHNKKGGPQIHVIIIGFEVSSEVADSVSIITCLTEKSLYIDAKGGLDKMDSAFETVASVITGTAITMETF